MCVYIYIYTIIDVFNVGQYIFWAFEILSFVLLSSFLIEKKNIFF